MDWIASGKRLHAKSVTDPKLCSEESVGVGTVGLHWSDGCTAVPPVRVWFRSRRVLTALKDPR